MSIEEFRNWQAFDQVDPIGGYRGDLRAASIINAFLGGKGDLRKLLVIDPFPMTEEQKAAIKQREDKEAKKAAIASLLSTLNRRATPVKNKD